MSADISLRLSVPTSVNARLAHTLFGTPATDAPPTPATPSLSFTPISFDRSTFLQSDFSPEQFLADRRHIALDRLKSELQHALRDLKNELVELINQDYADFISLSTQLVGVDKMIADLNRPLDKIKGEVQSVREAMTNVISSLEAKLEKRASIRDKKIEGDGKLIERVAIEFNQLQFLVSRGGNLPFVANIEWRIARVKDTLTTNLARALKQSYIAVMTKPEDIAAAASLTQFLRTYVLIDKIKEAGEVFKKAVLLPFIDKSAEFNPTSFPTVPGHKAVPLDDMYSKILVFARNDCAKVLEIADIAFRGTPYNLLSDAIWEPVTTALVKRIPSIFSPGIPEVFHKNYTATLHFVSEFEQICRTKKQLMELRNQPSYIEFMKRWQLAIYFQIRFKEIATDFEDATAALVDYSGNVAIDDGMIARKRIVSQVHAPTSTVQGSYSTQARF
ncbi:Conserved oligomeric Golgi complex subunit 2 [Borealophlyctis nickersoniae]|nr:Conserved oligomeric Golgi complex subunit 2 [Borealophlyctis nickersoniae]